MLANVVLACVKVQRCFIIVLQDSVLGIQISADRVIFIYFQRLIKQIILVIHDVCVIWWQRGSGGEAVDDGVPFTTC